MVLYNEKCCRASAGARDASAWRAREGEMGEPPAALVAFLDGIKLGAHVDVFMKLSYAPSCNTM